MRPRERTKLFVSTGENAYPDFTNRSRETGDVHYRVFIGRDILWRDDDE